MRGLGKVKRLITKCIDRFDTDVLNYKHKNGFATLDDVYTAGNNFATRLDDRGIYYFFAECINTVTRPSRGVIDIGCANGYTLSYFSSEKGLKVAGVEGAAAVRDYVDENIKELIRVADLRKDIRPLFNDIDIRDYDLVICTEVAEHVEPQFEDIFLDNVMSLVSNYLVFSWSPEWCPHRGTAKQEHWNPRPLEYVINKLSSKYNLKFCRQETKDLKDVLSNRSDFLSKYRHWVDHIIVFRK